MPRCSPSPAPLHAAETPPHPRRYTASAHPPHKREQRMAWVRVAWKERDREEEGVLPASWVDKEKNVVFWPNVFNVAKYIKESRTPTDGWKRFSLIKVKLRSDDYLQCESWDQTSGNETEQGTQCTQREKKKRRLGDFTYEEGACGDSCVERDSPDLFGNYDDPISDEDYIPQPESQDSPKRCSSNPVAKHRSAHKNHTKGPRLPAVPQKVQPLQSTTLLGNDDTALLTPRKAPSCPPKTRDDDDHAISDDETQISDDDHAISDEEPGSPRSPKRRSSNPMEKHGSALRKHRKEATPPAVKQKVRPLQQSPPSSENEVTAPSTSKKAPSCPRKTKEKGRGSRPVISSPFKKRPSSPYPMSQARFHRKVMELLVEIRDGIKDLKIDSSTEDTEYSQATTLEELEHLEESLKSTEERQKLIRRLSMVGGGTSTKNVKWIIDKLMTPDLQAQYNLCGRGSQKKLSFEKLRLYSVIIDSVQKSTPDSEMNIRRLIGEHLKFAPDRQKGGRKKVDGSEELSH